MTDLSGTETRLTATVGALSLILQKLVREVASLDSSMAERLEHSVRATLAETEAAANTKELDLFFRSMEDAIDTVFNAPGA